MRESWDVLVASSCMENRQHLENILENLSLNVISCSAISQAEEVIARQEIPLVFCDELLSDGCCRGLLSARGNTGQKASRIVVTIRAGEWDEYLEVMRLGAFDVMRSPVQPTDVELVVLRAMREHREAARQTISFGWPGSR
jgi:DNA-binding NtrC family response regulator